MSAPSIPQAIAQVVAWHNRHPLAERITPAQVLGVGVVALPFVAKRRQGATAAAGTEPLLEPAVEALPPASSLRERASALAQGAAATAPTPRASRPEAGEDLVPGRRAFNERFMPQPSLRRIATFARRFGSPAAPDDSLGPRRDVAMDHKLASGATALRYLGTAAIEDGARRVRVLWALAAPHQVFGPRLWSRTRVAMLGAASSTCVILAAVVLTWLQPVPVTGVPPVASAASAASAAAAAVASRAASTAPAAAARMVVAVAALPVPVAPKPEPQSEPEAEVVIAEPPPPALPGATAWPVSIRPHVDTGMRRHARAKGQSMRVVSKSTALKPHAKAAAPAPGAAFAVLARSTKSRLASEILLGFMQSAAGSQGKTSQHTEVVPDAQGWRASWWPFASRQEAERARKLLAVSGIHAEVVEF